MEYPTTPKPYFDLVKERTQERQNGILTSLRCCERQRLIVLGQLAQALRIDPCELIRAPHRR